MSLLYEGLIVKGQSGPIQAIISGHLGNLRHASIEMLPGVHFLIIDEPRSLPLHHRELTAAAIDLSSVLGPCLSVYYDDRIGLRVSQLFIGGRLSRSFGSADEKWLPVDKNNQPIESAPPLAPNELRDEAEYTCITNAIDLGLNQLGFALSADDLRRAATQH